MCVVFGCASVPFCNWFVTMATLQYRVSIEWCLNAAFCCDIAGTVVTASDGAGYLKCELRRITPLFNALSFIRIGQAGGSTRPKDAHRFSGTFQSTFGLVGNA